MRQLWLMSMNITIRLIKNGGPSCGCPHDKAPLFGVYVYRLETLDCINFSRESSPSRPNAIWAMVDFLGNPHNMYTNTPGLHIAQSSSHLCTLGPKVSIVDMKKYNSTKKAWLHSSGPNNNSGSSCFGHSCTCSLRPEQHGFTGTPGPFWRPLIVVLKET